MDTHVETGYRLISALFLRLLGLFYLIAFVSLAVQVLGLAGSDGILPIAGKLAAVPDPGWQQFLRMPTLFWLNSSDTALQAAAWGGAIVAVLILLGKRQRPALVAAWILYLSL